jgi:hypothetical protein
MAVRVPVVQAKVTLLPELPRGRRLLTTGQYRAHIVIGPQSQRVAIRDGKVCPEKYLGVMFVGGPEAMRPGEPCATSSTDQWLVDAPSLPWQSSVLAASPGENTYCAIPGCCNALTGSWAKSRLTSTIMFLSEVVLEVFRAGSVATQECNAKYQNQNQQPKQAKFKHGSSKNAGTLSRPRSFFGKS